MSHALVAASPLHSTLPAIAPAGAGHRVWASTVGELSHARLAHAAEWATVVQRTYGHTPLYLTADDGDGRAGALPAFVVRRPLAGTVVASMPFLDGGGPCSASPELSRSLVERIIVEAGRREAKFVDIRCAERLPIATPPATNKVNMRLPLADNADRLWSRFDKSVRNQIRKAERSGLSADWGRGELLAAFYEVYVERMRDLGSPAHDIRFFHAVLEAFGPRARVVLVRKGSVTIGGLIAIAFKGDLTVPWAACSKAYFALCPNMLLYWETIRSACADGFARFDFGRSTRESGTYRFKRQWGAQEETLFWYRIPIAGRRESERVALDGRSGTLVTDIWRRLPAALTRRIGPRIRRYLIQ